MRPGAVVNHLLDPLGFKLIRVPKESQKPWRPTIFLVTLPKSGSVFLSRSLCRTLDAVDGRATANYYPFDLIDQARLRSMMKGSYVLNSHLDASPINVSVLKLMVDRLVVHFRDPRQHLLSLLHSMETVYARRPDEIRVQRPLHPAGFFQWEFDKKIDWYIEHYLPIAIDWMLAWIEAVEGDLAGHVLLTDYRELLADNEAFLKKILEFYDVDDADVLLAQKDEATHFRSADPDEWRRVFSQDQIERVNNAIPAALSARFDWDD